MTEPKLSALVVVHNEEARLEACLARLAFADELVVVLDRCTDGSKEIAARHTRHLTSHLIEGAWENEGARRNTGIESCSGEWVLEVDADEWVGPELAGEIRRVVAASRADWHLIPVDNYVGARLVRYGWGASFGRSAHAGLFRKNAKRWGDQLVHPSLSLSGTPGGKLETPLQHFIDKDISGLVRKLDSYTTAHGADLLASGDIGSFAHNIRRIFSRFWKCFVARKGYREGYMGFLIALLASLYPILSYLKARFARDQKGRG